MMTCTRRASTRLAALLALTAACTAAPRASDTVVIASGADLESANPLVTIHPLARQVQRYALFVTLARYDAHLEPRPYFARNWQFSPDRRALTLSLVPSLRWDDGLPTTARDVAFTLDAARDPAVGFPRASDLAQLSSVSASDDSTVTLHFSASQPRFPSILCELPIVPAHRLARTPASAMRADSFAVHPIGNGPFRFVERVAGQRWELARNDAFPAAMGGAPKLRRLIIAVIDEAATKFAGLTSGELDLAGISPAMAPLVARDPLLRVIEYPVLQSYGIVFNVTRPPFDDARVRRALSLAIDRRRIVAVAVHGYGEPSSEAIPSTHPYARASAPESDTAPDTARADSLLNAAGWPLGADGLRHRAAESLTFELLTVGSSDNAAEQLIQSDLARIGVHVEIRQRELASFLAAARATPRHFDALYTGIPGDLSLSYLSAMFDTRFAGSALDYAGFHEPRLDSLLAAARAAPDADARARWTAVQRELDAAVPVAWIYHARGVQGASRRLRGVTMDLRGELTTVAAWYTAQAPR
ncbi:MAG TPA: peptide ABC transporter substrate-binding protein [Gemmatimonadaceae bacterium]|nr:peptide ABC transporter substrate-binding protein [Gemmatimonadaceae bacterium]